MKELLTAISDFIISLLLNVFNTFLLYKLINWFLYPQLNFEIKYSTVLGLFLTISFILTQSELNKDAGETNKAVFVLKNLFGNLLLFGSSYVIYILLF